MSFFLDQEAGEIIHRMTSDPFAFDGDLWLYWLFKLELIPGSWTATFYLEDNYKKLEPQRKYYGFGTPSNAVKEAYNQINKEWLEKGFAEGVKLNKKWMSHED
jgi:hypothetical protein